MTAGPKGDRFGIVVAFIDVTDQSFKTQTLIFDVNPVRKRKELICVREGSLTINFTQLSVQYPPKYCAICLVEIGQR